MAQSMLPRCKIGQINDGNEEENPKKTPENDTQRLPTSEGPTLQTNAGGGQAEQCSGAKLKAEKIQDGLKKTISDEAKAKIEDILDGANLLSDVEKLLLYLKLPAGVGLGYHKDATGASNLSTSRLEQVRSITWIKSHLEEDGDTSLPKQEVFDDYKIFCESHGYKFLSQADFGKVMKVVFPNVKPRRLGQRGQSKHCYGGLRKKANMQGPTLPDLSLVSIEEKKQSGPEGLEDTELVTSSCQLVCEWAQKLLPHNFSGIHELAECLVANNCVNSRSMAAFTILAAGRNNASSTNNNKKSSAVSSAAATNKATQNHNKKSSQVSHTSGSHSGGGGGGAAAASNNTLNSSVSSSNTSGGGSSSSSSTASSSRHREAQKQLQRKLKERGMIREQKRKLEQQRSEIEAADQNDSRDSNDSTQGNKLNHSSDGIRPRVASVGGRLDFMSRQGSTPRKLILPKTAATAATVNQGSVSCPTTPQGHGSKSNISSASASASVANGSSAQQILVFSPNAHSSSLNSQSVFILSPLSQKGGSTAPLPQGAIQTTSQALNIVPPTKEHGLAQLQAVQSHSSPQLAGNIASPGTSAQTGMVLATSSQVASPAAVPGPIPAGVVLTTPSSKSAASRQTGGVVLTTAPQLTAAPAVLQLVSTGSASAITVPGSGTACGQLPSGTRKTSQVTSHVTTTATSQGQVAVQVQHTPTDAKSKTKTVSVNSKGLGTTSRTVTSTTAVFSAAVKSYSGPPILTKQNAQSLLGESFNSRRSLLFDKGGSSGTNSPTTNSPSNGGTAVKKSILNLPQKQVNGHNVPQLSDPKQKSAVAGNENVNMVGSPTGSITSPLGGCDKDRLNKGNRLLNKTVSSLLKEQRGNVHSDPKATYVNDRRPVSELLREQREQQKQQSPSAATTCAETSSAQASPTSGGTIYLRRNSSGAVTSAKTLHTQTKNSPVHLLGVPKSSSAKDDVLSPNVSLAPKRNIIGENSGARKRFCSGDRHYNILQAPDGTLVEVLKTELSPDGSRKVKLLQRPVPSDFSGTSCNGQNGGLSVRPRVSRTQPTATVTSSTAAAGAAGTNALLRGIQEKRKREISICSDKDGFDYVGTEPDIDLADINPSIAQIMEANGQELKAKASRPEDAKSAEVSGKQLVAKVSIKEDMFPAAIGPQQTNNGNAQVQQTFTTQQQVTLQRLLNSMTQNRAVNRNTQGQIQGATGETVNRNNQAAVEALVAALANLQQTKLQQENQQRAANVQTQMLQQQLQVQANAQQLQQQQQQQQQASINFISQQDNGLNLQETSDQITSDVNINSTPVQQQQKPQLNVAQLSDLLLGISQSGIPELKQDVLLSQADTFQGRLMRSRSLSGPAQRKPPLSGATSVEEMVRQRSMSTIGFTGPGGHLNTNVLNTLQQVVAVSNGCHSVPQSPLCSTPMQPQQSPLIGGAGPGSMPNSRRSSFVGSVSSSPVGMMSPGGPNSSHCSATSTPISAYRSLGPSPVEPSNSFMPIQNSCYQDLSAAVNLVRPMVTVASALAQQTTISNPQLAQAPLLQGMREGSRFVPYPFGAATKDQQDLQQQLGLGATDNASAGVEGLDLSQNNQFNMLGGQSATALLQPQQQQQLGSRNPPPTYSIALQQQQPTGFNSVSGQLTLQHRLAEPLTSNGQLTLQQRLSVQQGLLEHQQKLQQQQQSTFTTNSNQSVLQQKLAEPLPTSHLILQQKLAEQQKLLAKSKEDGKFAPVSSIKPVKRGGKGSKPAASAKRQRHRSAQPAIGRNTSGGAPSAVGAPRARSSSGTNKNGLLQALLAGTNTTNTTPSLNTAHHSTGHKVTFNLPATTTTYPAAPLALPGTSMPSPLGGAPGTPESPFSPEIQTILDDGLTGGSVGSVFRSHSVPVQDMLGATGVNGDDAFDFLTGTGTSLLDQHQQSQSDLCNNSVSLAPGDPIMKSDLSSLLSNKMQQDTSMDAARGLHFLGNDDYNAKRNLTLVLEPKQLNQVVPSTDSSHSGVGLFDEAFNGGSFGNGPSEQEMAVFNRYTPKSDVTLASASLFGENRKFGQQNGGGIARRGMGAPPPTPPGSQTHTPDLSQELSLMSDSMQQQHLQQRQHPGTTQMFHSVGIPTTSSLGNGSVIAALLNGTASNLVDTPSSLDTLSGQDSRESLGDPFLHGFTDTVTDITVDLPSSTQSIDIGEPLDFTFSNVDSVMPQMVP